MGSRQGTLPCGPVPASLRIQDYQALIASLPDTDRPAFFGLPANIDRSSQRTVSSHVIAELKVLMRSQGSGDKFDREAWLQELAPLLNLWKRLNQVINNNNLLMIFKYIVGWPAMCFVVSQNQTYFIIEKLNNTVDQGPDLLVPSPLYNIWIIEFFNNEVGLCMYICTMPTSHNTHTHTHSHTHAHPHRVQSLSTRN